MGEAFGVCFSVIIGLIIFGVIIAVQAQSTNKVNETFSRLARRFGGRATPASLFQRPNVHFVHHGAYVLIDIYSTGGKHPTYYTQFHINWPDRHLRLEVYPERFMSRVGKFFGMEDIEIGSPAFDAEYIITGNDVGSIRPLLNAGVQAAIQRLRASTGNDHVYVSFGGGRLLVKKLGYLREYATLEGFTRLSLELFDQAMATGAEGIAFVEPEASLSLAEAMCQVCGEQIETSQQAAFCRSCKTPHHMDCWEYYGRCSTFGCGQTRYLVPRKGKGGRSAKPRQQA